MTDRSENEVLTTGDFADFEKFIIRKLASIGCRIAPTLETRALDPDDADTDTSVNTRERVISHLEALKRHLALLDKRTYDATTRRIENKILNFGPDVDGIPSTNSFQGAALQIEGVEIYRFEQLPVLKKQIETIDSYIAEIRGFE